MPKATLAFLIFLAIIASILLGINIGKKMGVNQYLTQIAPTPTLIISPTLIPSLTPIITEGFSLYRDETCGYEFSYRGILKEQQNEIYKSAMITNPDNTQQVLVATCQEEIPKPPLSPERIENIILDGVPTNLYHDASQKDGTPRDEIIVKHPDKNLEIIVAGFGPSFIEATSSFKFLQ